MRAIFAIHRGRIRRGPGGSAGGGPCQKSYRSYGREETAQVRSERRQGVERLGRLFHGGCARS
eukprot:10647348-Alexandrium_andersonii.AAC.1